MNVSPTPKEQHATALFPDDHAPGAYSTRKQPAQHDKIRDAGIRGVFYVLVGLHRGNNPPLGGSRFRFTTLSVRCQGSAEERLRWNPETVCP